MPPDFFGLKVRPASRTSARSRNADKISSSSAFIYLLIIVRISNNNNGGLESFRKRAQAQVLMFNSKLKTMHVYVSICQA